MIELGKSQDLLIVKKTEHGIYLAEEAKGAKDTVLLPTAQVPEDAHIGDKLTVFIYRDSQDRLIATTDQPFIKLGEVKVLKVVSVAKIGAFVDWGLPKDLLLPFREQTHKVKVGEPVLVALYVDKSNRLCLTMNVYDYLRCDSPYKEGDKVSGRVYEVSNKFGAFVAVDDTYSALVPQNELFGDVRIGRIVDGRVVKVREDGKLTLAVREKAYVQMDTDAAHVMQVIREFDGVLPFSDNADPEQIKREMNMSKAAFKRAVGRLYKERKIVIEEKCIRMVTEAEKPKKKYNK